MGNKYNFENTVDFAKRQDSQDELKEFRNRFQAYFKDVLSKKIPHLHL